MHRWRKHPVSAGCGVRAAHSSHGLLERQAAGRRVRNCGCCKRRLTCFPACRAECSRVVARRSTTTTPGGSMRKRSTTRIPNILAPPPSDQSILHSISCAQSMAHSFKLGTYGRSAGMLTPSPCVSLRWAAWAAAGRKRGQPRISQQTQCEQSVQHHVGFPLWFLAPTNWRYFWCGVSLARRWRGRKYLNWSRRECTQTAFKLVFCVMFVTRRFE